MKLFVLAIGGTGSRVLRSMVMQFASGVVPRNEKGEPIKDLTVVPIIIDPHKNNKAIDSANRLLENYRKIRKEVYGDASMESGFFAVKIDTLKNVATSEDGRYQFNDSFIFDMPEVSNTKFRDFLSIDRMEPADRLFSKMIFSKDELNTEMSEGFYGSPNIGTVALNIFQESDSFKALQQAIQEGDRMFFIGSIFGGTGAAGMPLLVSSFRQNKAKDSMAHSPMGALVVMPYFSIEDDEESPITQADFIIKTQTALRYYVDNLNPFLNDIYYVADTALPKAFKNDPGKGNQTGNKSHFVEYIGALAISDFLSQKYAPNEIWQKDEQTDRTEAHINGRTSHQFALKKADNRGNQYNITFTDLDAETKKLIMLPAMKFHLLDRFISGHLDELGGKTFAKENKIDKNSLGSELSEFLDQYNAWIKEMADHGDAHNLMLFEDFALPAVKDFSNIFAEVPRKKGFVGKSSLTADDILNALNNNASAMRNKFTPAQTPLARFMLMADPAMETAITKNLDVK